MTVNPTDNATNRVEFSTTLPYVRTFVVYLASEDMNVRTCATVYQHINYHTPRRYVVQHHRLFILLQHLVCKPTEVS